MRTFIVIRSHYPQFNPLRFELFRRITVPSLLSQTDKNFTVIVHCSNPQHQEEVLSVTEGLKVVTHTEHLNTNDQYQKPYFPGDETEEEVMRMVRMDDDDTISRDFIQRMKGFEQTLKPTVPGRKVAQELQPQAQSPDGGLVVQGGLQSPRGSFSFQEVSKEEGREVIKDRVADFAQRWFLFPNGYRVYNGFCEPMRNPQNQFLGVDTTRALGSVYSINHTTVRQQCFEEGDERPAWLFVRSRTTKSSGGRLPTTRNLKELEEFFDVDIDFLKRLK